MHFFSTVLSFAALTACITPVFSAPVAEPNFETSDVSLIEKRGGQLTDIAQTCYNGVHAKCDDITAKITAAGKIDADVAAKIVVDLQAIVDLIVKLGVDLTAKVKAGGLVAADVKACVIIVIAIVKLCASILLKIKAALAVGVSVSVFAAVVIKLAACIRVVIKLLISVCLSIILLVDLIVQLTACLTVFINACVSLGIIV